MIPFASYENAGGTSTGGLNLLEGYTASLDIPRLLKSQDPTGQRYPISIIRIPKGETPNIESFLRKFIDRNPALKEFVKRNADPDASLSELAHAILHPLRVDHPALSALPPELKAQLIGLTGISDKDKEALLSNVGFVPPAVIQQFEAVIAQQYAEAFKTAELNQTEVARTHFLLQLADLTAGLPGIYSQVLAGLALRPALTASDVIALTSAVLAVNGHSLNTPNYTDFWYNMAYTAAGAGATGYSNMAYSANASNPFVSFGFGFSSFYSMPPGTTPTIDWSQVPVPTPDNRPVSTPIAGVVVVGTPGTPGTTAFGAPVNPGDPDKPIDQMTGEELKQRLETITRTLETLKAMEGRSPLDMYRGAGLSSFSATKPEEPQQPPPPKNTPGEGDDGKIKLRAPGPGEAGS